MKGITRALSRHVAASQYEMLPPAVRHVGLHAFVNWVGCAAGGSREPDVTLILEVLSEFSGTKHATVVGRRERLDE